MPEGSLTVNIRAMEGSFSGVAELGGDETTGLSGAAAALAELDTSTADVSAQLVSLFAALLDYGSSVALDEITGRFPAVKLEVEVASPAEAFGDFEEKLEAANRAINGDLVGQMRTLINTTGDIRDRIPENGTEIVSSLLDQILRVLSSLEGAEAETIRAWVQSVEDLSRTVLPVIDAVNNGADASALVVEVFQQALSGVLDTFGFDSVDQFLQTIDALLNAALPTELLQAVTVTAEGVTVEYAQAVDLVAGDESAFQSAIDRTANALEDFRSELEPLLANLEQIVQAPLLQPGALESQLRSHFQTVLSVPIRDAQRIEDPFTALFDRLDSAIEAIDLSFVRDDVLGFFESTRETLETVNLGGIGEMLQTALASVEQVVADLDTGVLGALDDVKAFFDQLSEKVRGLVVPLGEFQPDGSFVYNFERDLGGLFQQTERAITGDSGNPDAPSVVNILQDFQDFLDDTLGEVTSQLEPVQAQITEVSQQAVEGIDSFNDFLAGLDIPQLLEDLRMQVADMLDRLAPIDFALIIDPVVEEFAENGRKLSEIDSESLNVLLKEALKAAIDLVVVIDVSGSVTPGIRDGFIEIRKVPQKAIDEIQAGYEEAIDLLDELHPEQLLDSLFSAFDVIKDAIATIKPAALLKPLDALYKKNVQDPLSGLDPTDLLEPVTEAFEEVTDAFGTIDSEDAIAPLSQLLERFKASIAGVDLTGWIDELLSMVADVQQRLSASQPSALLAPLATEFDRLETELDRVRPSTLFQPAVDLAIPLVSLIDEVQQSVVDALHQMFQPPLAVLDRINPESLTRQIVVMLDQVLADLRSLNIPGKFSQIKAQHFDLSAAVTAEISASAAAEIEAGGVEAAVEAEARAKLEARLNLLVTIDPNIELGPLVARYRALEQGLVAIKENVQTNSLQAMYTEVSDLLRGMLPAYGRELLDVETFKRMMRLADPTRFLQELETRFETIKTKLLPIRPEEIGAELDATYDSVVGLLEGLDIEVPLNQVKASLASVQGTVAAVRIDFLAADIDQAIQQVRSLIEAVDPAQMLAGLDTLYQQLLTVVNNTLPSQFLTGLQALFDQVQAVLDALDLETLLKTPLLEAWENIEAALEEIDITVVLSPLVDKLTELEVKLVDGLEAVEIGFDDMLRAARGALSGSPSASTNVSVGVG